MCDFSICKPNPNAPGTVAFPLSFLGVMCFFSVHFAYRSTYLFSACIGILCFGFIFIHVLEFVIDIIVILF